MKFGKKMIFAICFQFGYQKCGKRQRKFLKIGNEEMFISPGEIPQKKIFCRRKSNLKKKTNKMIFFPPWIPTNRKSNFPDWLGVKYNFPWGKFNYFKKEIQTSLGGIQEHLKFPRKSNFPWENKTS